MTPEEQLIQCYFEAFNRHDIEGVMACFHEHPVIVDAEGRRFEGREDVRRSYETSFALFPDGRRDLRSCTGNDGRGWRNRCFTAPVREREGSWRRSESRSWRSWPVRSKKSVITIGPSRQRPRRRSELIPTTVG